MAAENECEPMASAIVALCGVARHGLLTAEQFWAAFDRLAFFMVRPEYSGMQLFTSTDGKSARAVFHEDHDATLYVAMKVPGISESTYARLKAENDALFATVPVPPGATDLIFSMRG